MMSAAPTAIPARAAMSIAGLVARAAGIDTAPKIAKPAISAALRPYRSPATPEISRSGAITSG